MRRNDERGRGRRGHNNLPVLPPGQVAAHASPFAVSSRMNDQREVGRRKGEEIKGRNPHVLA